MIVVYADYQTLVDRANVIENKRREMKEKKRKLDVQRRLTNTHLRFATQAEYQSRPMNLLGSTAPNQYQQPNDEMQRFSSQEPYLSPPTITLITTNTTLVRKVMIVVRLNPIRTIVLRSLLRVIKARINSSRSQNRMSIRSR